MRQEALEINGVNAPRGDGVSFGATQDKLNGKNNLGKFQQILGDIPDMEFRRIIKRNGEFVYLGSVARKAGFHVGGRSISILYGIVGSSEIPIRKLTVGEQLKNGNSYFQTYYVVYAKDQVRIINALKINPETQKFMENPIQQIRGIGIQDESLPSSHDLKKEDFRSVRVLLRQVKIIVSKKRTIGQLLPSDCPIPIFAYRGRTFHYPVDQEKELKKFLRDRRQEILQR